MKVLMTTDTIGGVWTYSLDLSAALGALGVKVVLAAMGPSIRPIQCDEARAISTLNLEFRPYALEWMTSPWADIDASGRWLLDLAREHRPVLVHANGYAHGALPFGVPTVVVGHSCVYSWFRAVHGSEPPPTFARYHRRVCDGLRQADVVVAPSRAMLSALLDHYGPLRDGRMISNGRRLHQFVPARKQPFILSSGRLWDEAKNVASLERAAGRIEWPIYVAGESRGPEGKLLDLRAVTPLGALKPTRLASFMARASIYALPARYEPFGLSVVEAAASACALVLGDIPSLREIWGDAALYTAPDDSDALVNVLDDLTRSARTREAYARRARERALQLNERAMASSYLALYEEMLNRAKDEAPSQTEVVD